MVIINNWLCFILFLLIVQKINELEAALQKKDEDMKAMEERYKMYLEKARNVSDLSFRVQDFVACVLARPISPDFSAILVSVSNHFSLNCITLPVRFLWYFPISSHTLSLTHQCQIKLTTANRNCLDIDCSDVRESDGYKVWNL